MSDEPNDDLRKYLPGRDRARELSDANAAQERIARALEDAARAAKEDGANDSAPAIPVVPGHARGASFRGPRAPEPEPAPAEVPRRAVERQRKARWTTTLVSLLGVLAVLLPVTLALVLLARPTPPDRDSGAVVAAAPQGAPGVKGAPTAVATPLPVTTEAPTTAIAPEIEATSATSVPGASAAPSVGTGATAAAPPKAASPDRPHGHVKPAGSASHVPPGLAPSASPSTSPAAPPEPTGTAPRYTDPDF